MKSALVNFPACAPLGGAMEDGQTNGQSMRKLIRSLQAEVAQLKARLDELERKQL